MEPFDNWLLENYGFHPDYTPVRHTPPDFVTSDGTFKTAAYDRWKRERHFDYEKEIKS